MSATHEEPAEPSPEEAARARDQRAARNAVKLGALVRERWQAEGDAIALGTGAALVAGDTAYVLVEDDHGLGAAMAWSRRSGAHRLHVVADHDGIGALARQAEEFAMPVQVWRSEGRTLHPVPAEPVEPGAGPPDAPELVALLRSEGLDVVVEGDRLAGEYRGLEVVRIVRAVDDGAPILEVGVGRFDRILTAMMHGDLDGRDSIARVVDQLRTIRCPDGPPNHPLATLVPERWLRTTLVADPGLIGCDQLHPAPTPVPRDRLRPRGVAAAVGTRDGRPVVVGCSVGVDLEAVVGAADARAAIDPDATLLVALPARDALRATQAMVDDLRRPAELVAVHADWRR